MKKIIDFFLFNKSEENLNSDGEILSGLSYTLSRQNHNQNQKTGNENFKQKKSPPFGEDSLSRFHCHTSSTNPLKILLSFSPITPNIFVSVESFLVYECVVYFVTPLKSPHRLSPFSCNSPFKST